MRGSCLIAGLLLVGVSPVAARKPDRIVTPSGQADMQFLGITASEASGKLANRCMDGGLRVVANTASEVVCEARLDDVSSVLTQALMGNAYSTSPERYIRFTLLQNDKNVRVQATSWVQLQMALGQERREAVTSTGMHNSLMAFMEGAGASYFPGTSFGNDAFLGIVGLEKRAAIYQSKPVVATYVGDVFVDSPAERAGMQPGDMIVALNGIAFKNDKFWPMFLSIWTAGKTNKLTILRAGAEVILPVTGGLRPPITENMPPRQTMRARAQSASK